jgi:hypothetical protein
VSAGVPEREVGRVLRHASVETTRNHYAPGTVQESACVIRALLSRNQRHYVRDESLDDAASIASAAS